MCGITGIISDRLQENIKKQTDFINHRGPDDFGYFLEGNLALGHRRLSILDISENGHQPMATEDQDFVIVFNGEIYNHLEIRAGLSHYRFKSHSDTETLLYGFKEYGTELFAMLNGIFAFAIYDKCAQELIVVRDQFGVKPLYFFYDKETFLFSSELKSLLVSEHVSRELDYNALSNYINFLWCPGEQTPLRSVKKLLPGHFIKVNISNVEDYSYCKYYDIPFDGEYIENATEEALINQLDNLLEKAVKRQLLSDVPIGYFLSGGIDSSLLVAYARKINPDAKLECFTIDTGELADEEGFSSDLKYAKIVANHLNVTLNVIKADINIVENFDNMIFYLDEPQADAAPLNVFNICVAARKKGYKVLIGGAAGDDLFSGYRRHLALNLEPYYRIIPPSIGRIIKRIIGKLNSRKSFFRRLKKAVANIDKSKLARMVGYFEWIPLDKNYSLFHPKNRQSIEINTPYRYLKGLLKDIPNEKSDLNKMLYWEMKTFLVDHNLNYTDKLSMAAGVETRVPFLDKELVEFSTKIPPHLKLKGNTTKYLLKKVAERYLPKEVIYRAKTGFGASVRKWITEDLEGLIKEKLSKDRIENRGIFDYNSVQRLIEDNKKNRIDASYTIWSLLAIDSWYTQFIERNETNHTII